MGQSTRIALAFGGLLQPGLSITYSWYRLLQHLSPCMPLI